MSSKQKVGTKDKAKAAKTVKTAGTKTKRALSAYMLFCQDKRKEVQRSQPDLKGKQVVAELGRLWHELSDDEKARYKATSILNRDRANEETKEEEPREEPKASKKPPKSPPKSRSPAKSRSPVKPEPKKAKPADEEPPVDESKGKRGRRKC